MPVFFQHHIDNDTKLAVWKIEEGEPFFLTCVPLQRDITHPHKRLQHLAGRYLLRYLFPTFPIELIQIADTRKPYLENEAFHFSISHCGDYAAVIASKTKRVGIDIELVSDKVARIQHKFVTAAELAIMKGARLKEPDTPFQNAGRNHQLILLWSCKEAVFKWYGLGHMDFKEHMQAIGVTQSSANTYAVNMLLKKGEGRLLGLHSCFFDDLCLSYLAT